MQLYIDLIALATAVVAIWYTIRESRRNNSVVLRIEDCSTSGVEAINENAGQFFHKLTIVIQNRGIALHEVRASISFRDPDEHGRFNLSLERRKRSGDRDEFAKGMIAEFGFKSYKHEDYGTFLRLLRNPKAQDAKLCIYSQDYLAASFRIGGLLDRLRSRWNGWASRFNNLFTRKVGKNKQGLDVIRMYELLPSFTTLSPHIVRFCRCTEREQSENGLMQP